MDNKRKELRLPQWDTLDDYTKRCLQNSKKILMNDDLIEISLKLHKIAIIDYRDLRKYTNFILKFFDNIEISVNKQKINQTLIEYHFTESIFSDYQRGILKLNDIVDALSIYLNKILLNYL